MSLFGVVISMDSDSKLTFSFLFTRGEGCRPGNYVNYVMRCSFVQCHQREVCEENLPFNSTYSNPFVLARRSASAVRGGFAQLLSDALSIRKVCFHFL